MRAPALLLSLFALGPGCLIPGTSGSGDDAEGDTTGGSALQGELTVVTFNVRRLFDTNCDSGACGAGDYETLYSPEAFEARIDEIARALETVDADVVLLQEVETQLALDALDAALGDRYVSAIIGESGGSASVDTAILTAVPVDYVAHHGNVPIPLPGGGTTWFARELLEVQFEVDGVRVALFDAHFKSKNDDDPQRRLAEAMATELKLLERADELPDGLVILGGDLNDTPGSPPLDAIEQSMTLLRVASDIGSDATYQWNGTQQAIDHIFVSLESTGGSYVEQSALVFGEPGQGWGGSDHSALRATFRLGD